MKGCKDYAGDTSAWHSVKKPGLRPMRLIIVTIVILALAITVVFVWPKLQGGGFSVAAAEHTKPAEEDKNKTDLDANQSTTQSSTTDSDKAVAKGKITIYITGAVNSPGVFDLSLGDRLNDAITAAGGMTEHAAANYVNLAIKLEDGSHIHIPSNDEIASGEAARIASGGGATLGDGEGASTTDATSKQVNINTANQEQLMTLPGVGEATAKKIIDYREKNGKFKTKEDLKNVSGIGDKKFEDLSDQVCV